MPTLSKEQLAKAASIDPTRLAEARLISFLMAKEAASPGGAFDALVLAQLDQIFGDDAPKTAGIGDFLTGAYDSLKTNAGNAINSVKGSISNGAASMKELWPSVRSNVIGGLAGGALMGGAGYAMANRLPEESDEEFNSRRRRFALTSGIGGLAVGAATPTILQHTGLDKKIEGVWNEATMSPEDRAARAQAESAATAGAVQDKATANAASLAGLGATVGAATSLRNTDEHYKARQEAFKGKTDAMTSRRSELERMGTDRAGQIKANLNTGGAISAADAHKATLAEAQKAVQTATGALKNLRPGTPEYTAQQDAVLKAQQRIGSITGSGGRNSTRIQNAASKARAVEAWLAGKSPAAPAGVAPADAKFVTQNQRDVSRLTEQLANRGSGPSRAGVQARRTIKNTALGTVLSLIAPHLWDNARDAVPAIDTVASNFTKPQ